ncbi:MAG: GIY-YIG nuclease family protein [Anaerolineales bacterium]|nr:GIY-YIG nuclease family protein [Anaerolineales bacterium]
MNSNDFDDLIKNYRYLMEYLLNKELLPFDDKNLQAKLPNQGGVYCISEKSDKTIIYIGQSKNLRNRIYRNHLMGHQRNSTLRRKIVKKEKFSSEDQVKDYLHQHCLVQIIEIEDKLERNLFEHFAIAMLKPKYND